MSAPDTMIVEVPPGAGFAATNPTNVCVFAGCSSAGPLANSTQCNAQSFGAGQYTAIPGTYGCGPLSRKASYIAAKDGAPCLVIRLPATPRNASVSPLVNTLGGSSTIMPVVTGTPLDGFDVVIKVTVGGTLGTGPVDYQYSLDGGQTWSTTILMATALTITTGSAFTTATGLTVSFGGSGKIASTNDLVTFWCRSASASILPQTVTANVASTATYALSGTPSDSYQVVLQWITGGTVGTSGASYRISLDGGLSWQATTQLGTATTIVIADDTAGNSTGITVTLTSTQIITAADVVAFGTTAPEFQFSDLQTALNNLRAANNFQWSFLGALGPMSATDSGSLDSLLTGWATGTRRTFAITETRGRSSYETVAAWRTRVLADFANYSSTRVFPAAGGSQVTDPVTGRSNRRTAALQYLARLIYYPMDVDPGQVDLGPLTSDVTIFDVNGNPVDYDARTDSSLYDFGFLTLRSWEGMAGVYPTGGVCIAPSGQINLIAYRRILNAVEDALQAQMRLEVIASFRQWTATNAKLPYLAGDVYEADARAIERRLSFAVTAAVVTPGYVSSATVKLQRTPVPISGGKWKLIAKGKVVALGYIYGFEADVGIISASLDAALTQ